VQDVGARPRHDVDSDRRERKLRYQEIGRISASVKRKLVRDIVTREVRMIGRIMPVTLV
jgi:hypothetical protein